MSEFPVQVTIKPPATAASAPWLNFQAQDQAELEALILAAFEGIIYDSFAELVAKAYLEYAAVLTAAIGLQAPVAPVAAQNPVASIPVQGGAPVAPAAPSGPPAPQCPHGERKYLTSKPGAPKEWKAWMCNAAKDDPSKCAPQWIR